MHDKSGIRRSRTGCWACKGRHVKCDGARPSCSTCRRIGHVCSYGIRLVWQEESHSRGICHGRSRKKPHSSAVNVSRPLRATYQALSFLNTSASDVEAFYHHYTVPTRSSILVTQGPPSTTFNPLNTHRLSMLPSSTVLTDLDPLLLSYYEAVVCSSSTLLDDEVSNPYRHLILPMALQLDSVYHAIMAVTAQILSISDAKWHSIALEHSIMATQALARTIAHNSYDDANLREMEVLTLLLCWLDITNNSSASWLTHLYGMQSILEQSAHRARRPQTDHFRRFLTRYFAFHWVLARTAFAIDNADSASADGPQRSNQIQSVKCSSWTEYLAVYLPEEDMDNIDPYMGMSSSLLLLINEIAEVYHAATRDQSSEGRAVHRESLSRISNSLSNLVQKPPGSQESSVVICIAETNRLGALLYVHAVSALLFHKSGTNHTEERYEEGPAADDAHSLTKAILKLLTTDFDHVCRCAAMPLWPLFIAGCFCTEDEDRMVASSLFERIEGQSRFGNIAPAWKVVQCVWKQHDLGVQDDRKRRRTINQSAGGTHAQARPEKRFAWEEAMKMLGDWKLSLT